MAAEINLERARLIREIFKGRGMPEPTIRDLIAHFGRGNPEITIPRSAGERWSILKSSGISEGFDFNLLDSNQVAHAQFRDAIRELVSEKTPSPSTLPIKGISLPDDPLLAWSVKRLRAGGAN
ncbi:MAG: hypothetical protein ABH863_02700, partial [Candidatus Micrarchaeota archaeon]